MLGAALRFATLDSQSFDSDELFTAWLVQLPFGEMLDSVGQTEATPYLYYVLAWGWTHLGDTFGEVGLRSLSALAGTLTIPVAAVAAERVAGRGTALLTGGLVAVSPLLVWFSQQARAYALMTLFCGLTLLAAVRAIETRSNGWLAAWAVAAALAIATHYFSALVIAPQVVWMLRRSVWGAGRRAVWLAALAPAAVALALVPLAWAQRNNPGGIEGISLATRAAQVPKSFLIGFYSPAELAGTLVAGALALVAAVPLVRREGRAVRPAAIVAAGLVAVVVALPLVLAVVGLDFLAVRNVLPALVPALFVVAAGAAARRVSLVAAVALMALSVAIVISVPATPGFHRADLRGIADALGPAGEARALVTTPSTAPGPFSVYFPRSRGMPPGGASVAEVVLAATATQGTFGTGSPKPPRPVDIAAPAGFRLVERRLTETYTVLRFRARRPRMVRPAELARLALDPFAGLGVWLQRSR